MESERRKSISTYRPDILLGRPLNNVEAEYAPKTLYAAGPMEIPIPRPRVAS